MELPFKIQTCKTGHFLPSLMCNVSSYTAFNKLAKWKCHWQDFTHLHCVCCLRICSQTPCSASYHPPALLHFAVSNAYFFAQIFERKIRTHIIHGYNVTYQGYNNPVYKAHRMLCVHITHRSALRTAKHGKFLGCFVNWFLVRFAQWDTFTPSVFAPYFLP